MRWGVRASCHSAAARRAATSRARARDAGAYYYYNSEPGKTFQTTVVDALAYVRRAAVL